MTNTNMEIFKNEEFGSVRVVVIDNDPWFVGRDVAAALGYANTKDALGKHVEAEDKQIIQRSQNATFYYFYCSPQSSHPCVSPVR